MEGTRFPFSPSLPLRSWRSCSTCSRHGKGGTTYAHGGWLGLARVGLPLNERCQNFAETRLHGSGLSEETAESCLAYNRRLRTITDGDYGRSKVSCITRLMFWSCWIAIRKKSS